MEGLLKAVVEGDGGEVARLLDADPMLLEGANGTGHRPLTMAAVKGQLGVVELLVERGVNVDATGARDMTALQWAARMGHEEVVVFLLSKSTQASSLCQGVTPLRLAAGGGHLSVVRLLLQHVGKQGLQDADEEGHTALHYAVSGGHEEIVAYLLGQGAQAHNGDSIKMTPLMLACAQGLVGVMRAFRKHMGVQALQATDKNGYTPLHVASMRGHEEMVAFLLGQGAQTNSTTIRGTTPFTLAAMTGHLGVLRVLLQHVGTKALQETDDTGFTSLHYAAHEGHEEAVAFLLGQGAQASAKLLMMAACQGHLGVARLLIQHMGVHALQERHADGATILHWAANEGHEEILRLLLLARADRTITDRGGRTPRAIAEGKGHSICVAVFEWYECELERRAVLYRATCLHKAHTTQRDMPTSQMPTYLQARVAAGHVVPSVEVVSPQSQGQQEAEEQATGMGKRKATGEGGDAQGADSAKGEVHAMLQYVVKALNEELAVELLEGFHSEN